MADIQEEKPNVPLSIDRVGIKGVRRKISIYTPKEHQFETVLEAYVALPKTKRGIHMSRNIEAFVEAIEEARKRRVSSLEEVLKRACGFLLSKHPYATKAELVAKTLFYFLEDFTGRGVFQPAEVTITSSLDRGGRGWNTVSTKITGMTVCPSAQRTFSEAEGADLIQSPSHSQRVDLLIRVGTHDQFFDMKHLVEASQRAFSSPTVSLLKKREEYLLIKNAFERPRFIEDVLREALNHIYIVLKSSGYSLDTSIYIEAESYESIHPHNVFACREVTLGELVDEGLGQEAPPQPYQDQRGPV
jgi:GTP cyclohydrolase-4